MSIKRTSNPAINGSFSVSDVRISDADGSVFVFDTSSCLVFPGFVDVHVHLREPGFSY